MSGRGESFEQRLRYWLAGDGYDPVELLVAYLSTYTGGRFESIADSSDPNRITSSDIVAVSMLSVFVPPRAAAWILESRGSALITSLLQDIDPQPIWTQAESTLIDPEGPLTRLWALLQDRSSQVPPVDSENKVGPVIAGKLLAAKRPHLVPIYDEHVSRALQAPPGRWWQSWREALSDESTRAVVESIRDEAAGTDPAASNLSDLRVCDIVVWMAIHGRL